MKVALWIQIIILIKNRKKTGDGRGFSFTDKDGDLAASYKIDEDGYVTEYDEVDSGY